MIVAHPPSPPIGHQHDIRARQLRAFETHHQAHFAQSRQPHSQSKCPIGFVPHGHRPVRRGWDEQNEVFHGNLGPLKAKGFPAASLR